jgi:exonuclease SbcD
MVILLGGNHDSPATLGEGQQLLARLSTLVIPDVSANPADQVFVIDRRDGTPGMILCGIPFVRARHVMRSVPGQSHAEKSQALMDGLARYYADTYAAAVAKRSSLNMQLPIVATGHLATFGARSSESVREIYVGSLGAFPTNLLPPADYIALGHIHRPQVVGGHEHIRYCGSPVTLSFDELDQAKQVLLIDFHDGQRTSIQSVPVPVFQPLAQVQGSIEQLPERLAAASAGQSPDLPVWVEVTVEDGDYLPDLVARVNAMVECLPLEVLRLRKARGPFAADAIAPQAMTLDELTPEDVFDQVIASRGNVPEERLSTVNGLFREVLAEVRAGDAV